MVRIIVQYYMYDGIYLDVTKEYRIIATSRDLSMSVRGNKRAHTRAFYTHSAPLISSALPSDRVAPGETRACESLFINTCTYTRHRV